MTQVVLNALRHIVAWVASDPRRAFALFLALHAVLWIALPTLLYPNLPLDLIEALTYGREWQLGYDKLPPLPWWLVEIANVAVGHDIAYYALAQIAVCTAFALVFATALPIVGAPRALVAVLIVDGFHYFNFTAAKFNHDVIQLPFWALAGFSLHRAWRGGGLWYWALLGAALGVSLWAKYFVVVLAVPIALFLLIEPTARRALATPGPWLAAAIALAIMAPHLVWLVQNDFLPFVYASARAAPSRGLIDHLWHPLQFALGQIGFGIPALLISALVLFPRAEDATLRGDALDRCIVTLLAFGPFVTTLALSAATGRGTIAMWGYPLWLFLGVWIVLHVGDIAPQRLARTLAAWALVSAAFAFTFIASYTVLPRVDQRYRAVFYPGEASATELSRRYAAVTGRAPAYVISSMWEGGNVAHYAPSHPRVLIDGKPQRAPWIDLADLRRQGALVVWTESDPNTLPDAYRAIAPNAQVQPPFTVPFRRGDKTLTVGWAIVPAEPR